MRSSKSLLVLVLFGGTLLLSWATNGTGVVRDDPERNIAIPSDLIVPLQVQAAYTLGIIVVVSVALIVLGLWSRRAPQSA